MTTCFPPIALDTATVLILGSFPGKESLRRQQYYAHPRNTFWPIMENLFHLEAGLSYSDRVNALESHGIALWDVMLSCHREGSLDSDIDDTTIIANDFRSFFRKYKRIRSVFFNGAKAEKEYMRHVWNLLDPFSKALQYQRLPSTSPAMASLTPEEKRARWRCIIV